MIIEESTVVGLGVKSHVSHLPRLNIHTLKVGVLGTTEGRDSAKC